MEKNLLTPQGILDNAMDFGLRLSGTDFPVSIFPQPIQHIITELHECQSFPIDYVAASMLTAICKIPIILTPSDSCKLTPCLRSAFSRP